MKKVLIVAAAAGLMSLAACNGTTTQSDVNQANAEAISENIEMGADNLDALADNATNETTEAVLENAADNMHAAADNAVANVH